jgi:hypothetical protein
VISGPAVGEPDFVMHFVGDFLAEAFDRRAVPLSVYVAVDRPANFDEFHQPFLRKIGKVEVGLKWAAVVVEFKGPAFWLLISHGFPFE